MGIAWCSVHVAKKQGASFQSRRSKNGPRHSTIAKIPSLNVIEGSHVANSLDGVLPISYVISENRQQKGILDVVLFLKLRSQTASGSARPSSLRILV